MSSNRAFTICILVLGILFAYQVNMRNVLVDRFTLVESTLHNIDTRISKLHQYIKSFEISDKVDEKPKPVIAPDGIYDIQGHEPHSHYNVEMNPNDPVTPLYPDKEYTYDDFVKVFEVEPLHHNEYEPEVEELLKGHKVKDDYYYDQWKGELKVLRKKYTSFLEMDSLEERDRELMYIKWVSKQAGFGVFAKRDINSGELIGRYTGDVVLDASNTDYLWTYQSKVIKGEEVSIGIDALKRGNYLRFVNHKGAARNAIADYIAYQDKWQ